jgi:hypothetical protein
LCYDDDDDGGGGDCDGDKRGTWCNNVKEMLKIFIIELNECTQVY